MILAFLGSYKKLHSVWNLVEAIKMKKILLADDNVEISKVLKLYLEGEGYEVITAEDGKAGLKVVLEQEVELAILDIMMPELDGYELTKEIRNISNMPIIILSAKDQDHDKILGLNIGADDYVTKPFNPLEIVARVNASLRRHYELSGGDQHSAVIKAGELSLDTNSCRLTKGEEEIPLTATEYKILMLLMASPKRIFSKVQISEHINGVYFKNDDNVITVHISHFYVHQNLRVSSKNNE